MFRCVLLLFTALAEDEDATCLLHLKSVRSAEEAPAQTEPTDSANLAPVTSDEHKAWLNKHKALRESTQRQFPVEPAGVQPLALLATRERSTEESFAAPDDATAPDAAGDAAGDAEGPNTDDPFADDYLGWRSTPSPVHVVENISIGDMQFVDSPYISSNITEMQTFIDEQKRSSQACHAKLLEVRRTLDGILAKVNALSDIVEAHDSIVAGNTRVIEDNVANKNAGEKAYKEALAECHHQYGLDLLALEGTRKEIKELEQIANPDVRSSIDFNINYTAETYAHEQLIHSQAYREADREKESDAAKEAAEKKANETAAAAAAATPATAPTAPPAVAPAAPAPATGLVQRHRFAPPNLALLSEKQCHKLASVLLQTSVESSAKQQLHQRVHEAHRITRAGAVQHDEGPAYANDPATMEACSGKREELQKRFNEGWLELNRLLDDGVELAKTKKKECELMADNEHQERQDEYDRQIEDSTVNVKGATMAMRQLQGLLDNAKREVDLLEAHIKLLKDDCEVEDGVSDQLVAIRKLIQSLADCPGANDFRLTVPSQSMREDFERAVKIHEASDPGSTLIDEAATAAPEP